MKEKKIKLRSKLSLIERFYLKKCMKKYTKAELIRYFNNSTKISDNDKLLIINYIQKY